MAGFTIRKTQVDHKPYLIVPPYLDDLVMTAGVICHQHHCPQKLLCSLLNSLAALGSWSYFRRVGPIGLETLLKCKAVSSDIKAQEKKKKKRWI